ncbi:hypothetical protein Pfo_020423 [Paulownia fortunei]|nr:hypothetical protein Pfo_020423 [Paulownia fortunei]
MNILREGGLVSCPPLLEDSNYSYWKARMRAFIKSIDKKTWKSVVSSWQKNKKKEVVLKPENLWTALDNELARCNSKALNAIFSVVDSNQFRLITTCETVKEAWNILQVAYEGTASVRLSKLQMLASRFEDLRMEDNETIADFNAKFYDIANECHALGKKYDDTKLVRKTLRSLLDRFAHKVTAIDEAKDVTIISLDELIKRQKDKGIALQVEAHKIEDDAQTDNHDMTDPVVLLTQNFQKFLKSQKSKGGKNSDIPRYKSASNSSLFSIDRKDKQIQCRECEGYGHIQLECANTLKKKKGRSLNITWSDADSDNNQEEHDNVVSNRVALSAKQDKIVQSEKCYVTSHVQTPVGTSHILEASTDSVSKDKEKNCSNSDEEEPSDEDIRTMCRLMYKKWLEVCKIRYVAQGHDEILSTGHVGENHQGISYVGECSNTKMDPKSKIKFVKSTVTKPSIFNSGKKKVFQKLRLRRYVPICHYCHIPGHIRPKCFKLKNNLWNGKHIKKSDLWCNIANISLKASTCESWYFDNGCSKHMTSNKSNLSNFQSIEIGHVTFGDEVSGRILGKGTLDVKGLPRLKNVLLIEGLKTNLISISQLCDQSLFVHFTKDLNDVGTSLYRSMIESLLYLTTSRLNICFSVGVCARYQSDLKDSHLKAVKWIIRYMNGTSHYGIWYSKDTNSNLADYCDTDWTGDMDDWKNTSSGCFFLSNNLISWFSKKQNCVSLSIIESEYIIYGNYCESSDAQAKRENPSGAIIGTSPTLEIPMEPEVDVVPLPIEYPPLEITFEPHKGTPIIEEEQVIEPIQGSSSFHNPATSLANTVEVAETLRDFHQGQGTNPIGEDAHYVPNSVPQPTARLSTFSDSVEFTVVALVVFLFKALFEHEAEQHKFQKNSNLKVTFILRDIRITYPLLFHLLLERGLDHLLLYLIIF